MYPPKSKVKLKLFLNSLTNVECTNDHLLELASSRPARHRLPPILATCVSSSWRSCKNIYYLLRKKLFPHFCSCYNCLQHQIGLKSSRGAAMSQKYLVRHQLGIELRARKQRRSSSPSGGKPRAAAAQVACYTKSVPDHEVDPWSSKTHVYWPTLRTFKNYCRVYIICLKIIRPWSGHVRSIWTSPDT